MIPFPGTFYWRNKTRSVPLFILISLSVAVIGVVATLTGSILGSIYSVDVLPFEYFSLLVSKDLVISDSVIATLQQNPTIDRLIPFLDSSIRVTGLFGSEQRRIYALEETNMKSVLERLDLHLVAGYLPTKGTNELVLHESVMKSKNLVIGDFVGQEIDKDDYLWGKFRVSGIITGPLPIGIASLKYFKQQWMFDLGDNSYALMAFPSENVNTMNKSLYSRPSDRLTVRSFDSTFELYKAESREMDLLLWIVNLAIICIISLSVGMLNTIHFLSRMKEYGVLLMIGLSLESLIKRTFIEVLIMSFVGFVGGTTISWILTWSISTQVFAPRGIPVHILSWRYMFFTLPIPVFLALFSFFTISWNVKRMDIIAIIEGRD